MWLYYNFIGWLNFLNATLPPIGLILVLDYFMNRKNYETDKPVIEKVNPSAVLGVVLGALVGNFVPWGIASLNAMATAAVCYLVYNKIIRK